MSRAKARERRQERQEQQNGRAPKAQIVTTAKLVAVKSAKAKDSHYNSRPSNALEVTFNVKMGAPEKAASWKAFRDGNSYTLRYQLKEKAEGPKPPKRKAKETDEQYQERTGIDPNAAAPIAAKFDVEARIDELLKPKWEEHCAKVARHNARVMNGAAAYAIFFALMNSTVRLSIAPAQQGFAEMFAGQAETPQLGAGLDDDDDDMGGDVDDEDLLGDDDGEDGDD